MVLLTHGYYLNEDEREQRILKPYPPLGILYISAWLDRNGVENAVFDTTFSSPSAQQAYLLEHRPPIVALYVNLMTKLNVLATIRFIRSQPSLRDTWVVLGGPDVTHNLQEYLSHGADVVVVGEGEQTMLEISQLRLAVNDVRRTVEGENASTPPSAVSRKPYADLEKIPGVAFLLEDGSVFRTQARTHLKGLDELPLPNRQKIDLQQYLNTWRNAHGHATVSVSTQRGCPYTCRWCSTAVYGQSYRRRSPTAVVDEIVALQAAYDFDLIWFVDDVFTVSHRWLAEFRDELARRSVQVRYECITRADRLTDEVVEMLRESGCFRVWIGAESGSQRIIDAMDRRVDVQQVQKMIQAARRTGIEAGTFIMLGYPGETEDDIRATLEHLKACNPHLFTITVAYPIKGTGLYEEVEASAHTTLDWGERTDRDVDFKRTYARRYYDFAVRWTVNAVHLYQARLAGRLWTWHSARLALKVVFARLGMWWWRRSPAPKTAVLAFLEF